MNEYEIKVVSVKHVPAVGNDLQLRATTRVTIMVGQHGPFTHDFAEGADTPENINAWKQQQQQAVRAIVG